MRAERHPQEDARLAALRSYEVLDTPPEAEFDDLVALASRLCETPVALVSLVDEDRQWFKATVGTDLREMPLDASLCGHIILHGGLFEIDDMRRDPRFADNPAVTGDLAMRFYAGTTLETPDGLPIGTLCVLDTQTRELNDLQREALRVLGRQAMTQLELRRRMREGEAHRRAVQETLAQAEIATWVRTRNPDRVYANPVFRHLFGLPPEADDVPLDEVMRAVHPDDRERVRTAAAAAIENRTPYELEYRVVDADGRERWVLARAHLAEETNAFSGIVMDVTLRKTAERTLEAERAQFRRLLDEVPAHIVTLHGEDLRYEFANRAFLDFVGRSDFLGMRAEDAWPVPPEHLAMLRGILATGEPVVGLSEPVSLPGGGVGFYDFMFQPLREPDGAVSGVFVHSLDVTDKVVARESLLQSEERFRAAQETTPDAFTIVESVRNEAGAVEDFRWVYVNPAAERLADQSKEVLLGGRMLDLRPWVRENGLLDAFVRVVETGEPFSQERFVSTAPGRYVRVTAVRVGDGVAVSFADITDRKRAEEDLRDAVADRTKELREAVAEAERFNYSISHDLRTPLRAISMTAHVLLDEAGSALTDEHRELLERQAYNARRLGGLIDGLLRLSRLGRVAMTKGPLDVTALACAVVDEMRLANGEALCAIEVQTGMAAEGDPGLVRLVLLNLIENACKFSPNGGAVRVGEADGAFFVSDEGVGFDMRHAAKMFQPFERLHREDEFPGTGIGLANVERIVRRHGGRVWAQSAPGAGATFWFTLA